MAPLVDYLSLVLVCHSQLNLSTGFIGLNLNMAAASTSRDTDAPLAAHDGRIDRVRLYELIKH